MLGHHWQPLVVTDHKMGKAGNLLLLLLLAANGVASVSKLMNSMKLVIPFAFIFGVN